MGRPTEFVVARSQEAKPLFPTVLPGKRGAKATVGSTGEETSGRAREVAQQVKWML